MADRSQTVEFLVTLFGASLPDGARIALWSRQGKDSLYLERPDQAAEYEGQTDVYVTAGLVPATLTARTRRLKARECAGIPGVWIDVDVNGGPEDKQGAAPDREAAERLSRVELPPTLLINSGYGLQAWWLFDEPWVFGMDDERDQAARITEGWETIHRNHARREGYKLDTTCDLARLMRLPGTFNGKGGLQAPVTIVEGDGPRYGMETISERALALAPTAVEVRVNMAVSLPEAKFNALIENDDFFRKTWEHHRPKLTDQSLSGYDFALALHAVSAHWGDDEIAALIRAHREKYGDTSGKANRADYLEATIAKARLIVNRQEQERSAQRAGEQVVIHDEQGTLTSDIAFSGFNTLLRAGFGDAPVIKELVQYSSDPDEARFVFVLDDGREINVGEYANLREPRKLDRRIGPAVGWVMPTVRDSDDWRRLISAVLKHRTLHEDPEPQIVTWLKAYLHERLGAPREEAAAHGEPFVENGSVYVKLPSLHRFVNTALRERVRKADLPALLRARGFERETLHLDVEGGRTTNSYWMAPREELE